ncbi:MAG: ribonuclease HII [Epsilonproteobacteria bacterium]|nr:ribonuclease HII [Campylobacterota bacterium]NPA57593.1 ribonuclease HII [Campylobacterota bacterium]
MALCGIDEAGRGPLAGPLVVAGVLLKGEIEGLDDSKRLSPRRREELSEVIRERALYHIVVVGHDEIDRKGLSASLARALREIISTIEAQEYLFDGNCPFGVAGVRTLVGGDRKVDAIKAASILAKVTRDRLMEEFDRLYPQYGFRRNKGYGTREHIEALRRYGPSPIHRRSFRPKGLQPTLFD